ncbi:putative membrane protein YuiD [Cocos nucifera]|uniref:Putative membrane protein YuiD n=1 Tax=Cocos nucifera TaxID=13894 RepID=A0A8K0MZ67_COCNU|nr:putative membrane protein YuiD [Cocos nucifera]
MSYLSSLAAFPRSVQQRPFIYSIPPRRPKSPTSCLRIGAEEIAELAHNKVLVAATLASAIGQLSKPLTSAINGKGIDPKAAVRAGGMPSTHSAGVVAAATSLGLERGFSDSIFGMSVVFAALVMYDAQGVRREVGYHAKILNKILKIQDKSTLDPEEDLNDSKHGTSSINSEEIVPLVSISEKANSYTSRLESRQVCCSGITPSKLGAMPSLKVDVKDSSEKTFSKCSPLNELVGHTEIQVLVGALLGFVVSLAIDATL